MNLIKNMEKVSGSRCAEIWISTNSFDYRYYAPYFAGSGITSYANVSVERRIDREAYVGICEDTKSRHQPGILSAEYDGISEREADWRKKYQVFFCYFVRTLQ